MKHWKSCDYFAIRKENRHRQHIAGLECKSLNCSVEELIMSWDLATVAYEPVFVETQTKYYLIKWSKIQPLIETCYLVSVNWSKTLISVISFSRFCELYIESFSYFSICNYLIFALEIHFRDPEFESCIQQRKTTCLLSIRKSLACARASKLTTIDKVNELIFISLALW